MCCCTKGQEERENSTNNRKINLISDPSEDDDCPLKKEKQAQEKKKEEEDEDWVAEAKREAKELREQAKSYTRDNVDKVAAQLTQGATQWLNKRADFLIKKADEIPKFAVVATGSFARGDMAPHSDTDFVFIRNEEDKVAFDKLKSSFCGTMSTKLHDNKGGFSVDDVAGTVFTPQTLLEASKKQDASLLYVSPSGGKELYTTWRELRQTPQMAKKAIKRMDIDRDDAWVPFHHTFVLGQNRTYNSSPEIHVKNKLLKLITFPFGHLADYHDCMEGREPQLLGTADRIKAYMPDGKLKERILEDFRYLLWLRFEMHFKYGKEQDTVSPKDEEYWGELEKAAFGRLKDDFTALHDWYLEIIEKLK